MIEKAEIKLSHLTFELAPYLTRAIQIGLASKNQIILSKAEDIEINDDDWDKIKSYINSMYLNYFDSLNEDDVISNWPRMYVEYVEDDFSQLKFKDKITAPMKKLLKTALYRLSLGFVDINTIIARAEAIAQMDGKELAVEYIAESIHFCKIIK